MSQHDFEIANQGFPAFRADLNNSLQALASNSSGTTEPTTTYAYQMWYDETTDLLKMRNSDDDAWITLASFDQTNDEWEIRSAVIQAVDSAGVVIKTDDGTARITVNDNGTVDFANSIDVTGTVTADGLTVDAASVVAVRNAGTAELKIHGNVNSSASVPTLSFIRGTGDSAFADAYTDHQLQSAGGVLYLKSGESSTSRINATFNGNGDISFYEDTGTTPKLFWDASEERLGIGTTSPLGELHIADTAANAVIRLESSDSGVGNIIFDNQSGANRGSVKYDHSTDSLSFQTNGVGDDVVIDSSGNLLVGKTSTDLALDGSNLLADGFVGAARDNNVVAILNRKTSDGDILQFRKNNSPVGSIGTNGGDVYIGTGDTSVRFIDSLDCLLPFNTSTNATRDAAIDIGYNDGGRFKDLYLSGGVYLGGTGSANKLEDYEEGTWTPEFVLTDLSASSQTSSGYYTKIGNKVFVQGFARISGTNLSGTGGLSTLSIQTLPFTSSNIGFQWVGRPTAVGRIESFFGANNSSDFNEIYLYISANSTSLALGVNKLPPSPDTTDFLQAMAEKSLNGMVGQSGNIEFRFELHYQTDS